MDGEESREKVSLLKDSDRYQDFGSRHTKRERERERDSQGIRDDDPQGKHLKKTTRKPSFTAERNEQELSFLSSFPCGRFSLVSRGDLICLLITLMHVWLHKRRDESVKEEETSFTQRHDIIYRVNSERNLVPEYTS
jgi:hypothetical protein